MIRALQARLNDDPRLSRVLKGGISGVFGKFAGVLVNAVSLPITLRYLGREEYGFWVTISTSIMMLAMLDLGIANTLTNSISRAYAERSEEMAKRYYATAFWATCVIAMVLGLMSAAIWPHINWGRLFGLSAPMMAQQAGQCAAISFGYVLLTLPLGLANRVMGGYQRVPVANMFGILNSVLGLGATILVIWMHGTVVHLMAAFCTAMLTGTILLNLWMGFRHEPRIRPAPRRVHLGAAREIMGNGMLFFILQIAGLARLQFRQSHYCALPRSRAGDSLRSYLATGRICLDVAVAAGPPRCGRRFRRPMPDGIWFGFVLLTVMLCVPPYWL